VLKHGTNSTEGGSPIWEDRNRRAGEPQILPRYHFKPLAAAPSSCGYLRSLPPLPILCPRPRRIENPALRSPVEALAALDGDYAERFERARKAGV